MIESGIMRWKPLILLLAGCLMVFQSGDAAGFQGYASENPPVVSEEAMAAYLETAPFAGSDLADVVASMHGAYLEQYREAAARYAGQWKEIDARRRALREAAGDDYDPYADEPELGVRAVIHAWNIASRELNRAIREDIANILVEEDHRESWRRFAQTQRRRSLLIEMSPYLSSAAQMDLTLELDALPLSADEQQRLMPLIAQYADAMDGPLIRFEAIVDRVHDGIRQTMFRPASDRERTIERRRALFAELEPMFKSVAAINADFTTVLADVLTDANRVVFIAGRKARTLPILYRDGPVTHAVDIIRSEQLVDARGLESVDDLLLEYELRRGALRERILAACQRWGQPNRVKRRIEERDRLIRANNRGETVDTEAPLRGHPAVPLLRQLLDLEVEATQRLRWLIGVDVLAGAPVELQLLLTWGPVD